MKAVFVYERPADEDFDPWWNFVGIKPDNENLTGIQNMAEQRNGTMVVLDLETPTD